MIYPEIPKTKFRSTYIAGGIFAFLIGIIANFMNTELFALPMKNEAPTEKIRMTGKSVLM